MSDHKTRTSALGTVYRPGDCEATASPKQTLSLCERGSLSIIRIAARQEHAETAIEAIDHLFGVTPPSAPNSGTSSPTTAILRDSPGSWLIVEAERHGSNLEEMLRGALCETPVTVIDLSHSKTVLRITGPRTPDLLAKGCSLDFHPRVFVPGTCMLGLLAHVSALFHAVDNLPTVDVYVGRSLAISVWEWLTTSAVEWGYKIESC